jgi:hypothetical protein
MMHMDLNNLIIKDVVLSIAEMVTYPVGEKF